MNSMMRRTTRREIWNSFGRYLAILSIIALGVGFFAGLKMTKPTMVAIVDEYVRQQALFDYRLICTLGFEEEDVEAFYEAEDVRAVEGAVFADVIYRYGEEESEQVAAMHSLTEALNILDLRVGRMPQAPNECVVDYDLFSEDAIGNQIIISEGNKEETLDLLTYDTYTIVGLAASPAYMNFERGNASVGNGVISGFIYIPKEGFTFDYYTEIYLKLEADEEIYSSAYEAYIDAHTPEIEAILDRQTKRREDAVRAQFQEEIDDAQAELDAEAEDAFQELEDARVRLEDGQEEIDDAREELESSEAELRDAVSQLNDGIAQIDDGLEQLNDGIRQAQDGIQQLTEAVGLYDSYLIPLEELFAQMAAAGLSPAEAAPEQAMQYQQLLAEKGALEEQLLMVQQTEAGLTAQRDALTAQRAELADNLAQAQDGLSQIADGYQELADAQEELDEGYGEYQDGLSEYETQIADAQSEIDEAREELEKMEEASYFLLDRETNIGYVCFENDANIVEEIATVFPVFFFLVAVLVCMTTMNRMIEEQRTQIGVLKALGYGEASIMGKYMAYSGSAAMIGCVSGYAVGTWLFPKVIWLTYDIMYTVSGSAYLFDIRLALLSIAVSLLCSVGTTWLSCRIELGSVAAQLIRPRAPKSGKRIFLERIPFIWKRMKFLHKVSARNILRYKKRFFMMVIGISGSAALVITGLGLRDSIVDVVTEQYGRIHMYDIGVSLKEEQDSEEREAFLTRTADFMENYLYYMTESVDLVSKEGTRSITVIVPENEEILTEFLGLYNTAGERIAYPRGDEAILSRKAAERLSLQEGDRVLVRDSDLTEWTVTIIGICDNYVSDYLYLSKDVYIEQLGEMPEYRSIFCHVREGSDVHEAGAWIAEDENVASVNVTADMRERVEAMIANLDYIIVLVIGCAAALAFIVLYNLTNINITERIREIATIKVLGFYPGETAAYVFRENMVLTAIGALVGLPLGIWLHSFVMHSIDIDGVSFQIKIAPVSYLFSIVLTFLFALMVNGFMYFKLQKIDMAESLKSIE